MYVRGESDRDQGNVPRGPHTVTYLLRPVVRKWREQHASRLARRFRPASFESRSDKEAAARNR